MSDVDDIKVELRQGNPSVRRLVEAALGEEGFSFVEVASDDLADLLVVDVDSGLDVDAVIEAYDDAGKSVLVSGLRRSRERSEVGDFLERPFTMANLVHACRKACGVAPSMSGATESDVEATQEDIFMEEEPEDLSGSGPTTREMEDDEAGLLEEQLGLQSGQLRDSSELAALQESSQSDDIVEVDSADSIVLDVDDLEELDAGAGGRVQGEIAARSVDIDALQGEADRLEPPPALSKPPASETMPDAPAVKRESGQDTQADGVSGIGSSPKKRRPTTGLSQRRRSSGASAGLPDQLVETLSLTSDLIAEHWNAVSLAARPSDRAERIERVILAALSDGPSAAEDELRRIPVQDGFSGSLGSWGLRDVLMVLIFRRLRGRLEVSVEDSDYVLFIDQGKLDEIENLAGDNDLLLLEVLRENDAISDDLFEQLDAELDNELSAPLEMKLRSSSLVDTDEIQQAKRDRARSLFATLLATGDTGWFAFMQVGEQDGHSWPVNPLEVGLDELMSQNVSDETDAGRDEEQTVSASNAPLPALHADSNPATREVPEVGPTPASVSPPASEQPADGPSRELGGGSNVANFQGETRESAPWEIGVPPEAEPSEAEEQADEPQPDEASARLEQNQDESKKAAEGSKRKPNQGKTVESSATDISLPDDADDFFGDSRELDDLLKSVVEDSDAEVD